MNTLSRSDASPRFSKVPEVTIFFWIIKVMATTVGETAAGLFNVNQGFGLAGTAWATSAVLLVLLTLQLKVRKYVPWIYWATVVMLSVSGTLLTDILLDRAGVSLHTTVAVLGAALVATFALWHATERSLSILPIFTIRRETFYWAAILFTFAFGTAAGDLVAESLHLGHARSVLLFAGLIGLVVVAHYVFRLHAIAAFWITYILTRPLGASCGDWLSKPLADGGLGLGSTGTSELFLATILTLVVYLTVSQRDMLTYGR